MKKIIVGAGENGRYYLQYFGGENVLCFADSKRSGQVLDGKNVISFQQLSGYEGKCEIIICSQKYGDEIHRELLALGVQQAERVENILFREIAGRSLLSKKRIFLLNDHDGVNVGDHLISIAEQYFFSEYMPEYDLHAIPQSLCQGNLSELKQFVQSQDLLVISGGGYLGDLWLYGGELNVQNIIASFPQNRIVIFPQTIYYQDRNDIAAKQTAKIFNAHKNLSVCFRDMNSYKIGLAMFQEHVNKFYMPDIAALLNRSDEFYPRKGVVLCMRVDKEKICPDEWVSQIRALCGKRSLDIENMTMILDQRIPPSKRVKCIEDRIKVIQKKQLVITDRLHCMILCAITATPCIALNNLTQKLSGAYEWLKNNQYLRIANEISAIPELIDELLGREPDTYNNKQIQICFQKLADTLMLE